MRTCLPAPYLETLYYSQTQHTPTTISFPRSPHSFPPSVRLLLTAPLHSTDYLGPISLFSLFAITSSHSPFIHSYSLALPVAALHAPALSVISMCVRPADLIPPIQPLNQRSAVLSHFEHSRVQRSTSHLVLKHLLKHVQSLWHN